MLRAISFIFNAACIAAIAAVLLGQARCVGPAYERHIEVRP